MATDAAVAAALREIRASPLWQGHARSGRNSHSATGHETRFCFRGGKADGRTAVHGFPVCREPAFLPYLCGFQGSPVPSGAAEKRSVGAPGWLVAVDGRIELGQWETDGTKRHDDTVVGNVEFLAAPRPTEEPEPAKPARKNKEPVAA